MSTTEWIISVAAVCVALTNIYNFIKRPSVALKEKTDEMRDAHLKEITEAVSKSVVEQIQPQLDELKQLVMEQGERVKLLTSGELDLLRQQILYIYQDNCQAQTLTTYQKQQLEKLYHDYTAQGGNSFVQEIYEKIKDWNITP